MPSLEIRAQPLGQTWRAYGNDLRRGIYPEDFQCSVNENGCLDATWTLRRDPKTAWPDLLARTPIEVDIGGMCLWSGRIKSAAGTSGDDRQIQVAAEGWQFAADDRPFTNLFARAALGDWTDLRSSSQTDLTKYTAATQISSDPAGTTLTLPQNQQRGALCGGGVFIDAGPGQTIQRVVVSWRHSNNAVGTALQWASGATIGALNTGLTTLTNLASNATATMAFTLSTPQRYVSLAIVDTTSAVATPTADVYLTFTALQVFSSTAYESGNASILKADVIVKDALARMALLDQSTAGIQTPTFAIPTFSIGQQTPREAIDAANAFQAWQWSVGANRKLVYRPLPSAPIISATDEAQFDQASAGDASSVYNEVTYVGTGPDGTPVVVTRTSTLAGLPQTVMDKRGDVHGFTISSSGAVLTAAAASQLCDVFLQQRNRTPLKGTLRVASSKGVRLNQGGVPLAPAQLLRYGGELVSLRNIQDPDTGALGRDGRIAQVTYTHASDSAQIAIDSTPGAFEAVTARLAVVMGQ